jgi:prevent-host-death family protein
MDPSHLPDITAADARREWSGLLNRVAFGKERVVVTRHGKPLAALVPVEDLGLLERVRGLLRGRDVRDALAEVDELGAVSWEALRSELGL